MGIHDMKECDEKTEELIHSMAIKSYTSDELVQDENKLNEYFEKIKQYEIGINGLFMKPLAGVGGPHRAREYINFKSTREVETAFKGRDSNGKLNRFIVTDDEGNVK